MHGHLSQSKNGNIVIGASRESDSTTTDRHPLLIHNGAINHDGRTSSLKSMGVCLLCAPPQTQTQSSKY